MSLYDASTALVVDCRTISPIRPARWATGALVAYTQDWVISLWRDMASIAAFAGEDPTRARYFPGDERFLL